jgi:hypothetical protein
MEVYMNTFDTHEIEILVLQLQLLKNYNKCYYLGNGYHKP